MASWLARCCISGSHASQHASLAPCTSRLLHLLASGACTAAGRADAPCSRWPARMLLRQRQGLQLPLRWPRSGDAVAPGCSQRPLPAAAPRDTDTATPRPAQQQLQALPLPLTQASKPLASECGRALQGCMCMGLARCKPPFCRCCSHASQEPNTLAAAGRIQEHGCLHPALVQQQLQTTAAAVAPGWLWCRLLPCTAGPCEIRSAAAIEAMTAAWSRLV